MGFSYLYEIRCTYEAKGEPIYGGRVNKGCSTRYSDSRFVVIVSEKQPEIGLVIALAFGVMALVIAFGKAGAVIGAIEDAIDKAGIDARLLVPVLKVTGSIHNPVFS